MNITIDRTTILKALEAAARPLQRYDLVMEVFWAAGYDRTTYRNVYDLRGGHSQCTSLIDTLRADGEVVLLPSTQWRRILGPEFDTTSGHGRRGHHWYATRDQHTRWTQADRDRADRLAAITTRLEAAALPPLHIRQTVWTDDGHLVYEDHPGAQHSDLEFCTPDGARVGEVACNYGPTDTDNPIKALAGAKASAELFAHAPNDIAYLLTLLADGDHK